MPTLARLRSWYSVNYEPQNFDNNDLESVLLRHKHIFTVSDFEGGLYVFRNSQVFGDIFGWDVLLWRLGRTLLSCMPACDQPCHWILYRFREIKRQYTVSWWLTVWLSTLISTLRFHKSDWLPWRYRLRLCFPHGRRYMHMRHSHRSWRFGAFLKRLPAACSSRQSCRLKLGFVMCVEYWGFHDSSDERMKVG